MPDRERWTIWLDPDGRPLGIKGAFLLGDPDIPRTPIEVVPLAEIKRLREAEAHLWALVVWFGDRYDHPYVDRDVAAAATYVNQNLSGEDMTKCHRDILARYEPAEVRCEQDVYAKATRTARSEADHA